MVLSENEILIKSSLFVEIRTKSDLLFLFSNLKSENQLKKDLKDILKGIFLLNGFSLSEKSINKYFENYINFIVQNLKDNIIKSSNDLKYYLENELELTIENEQYLFYRFFNNEYKTIENFLFVNVNE